MRLSLRESNGNTLTRNGFQTGSAAIIKKTNPHRIIAPFSNLFSMTSIFLPQTLLSYMGFEFYSGWHGGRGLSFHKDIVQFQDTRKPPPELCLTSKRAASHQCPINVASGSTHTLACFLLLSSIGITTATSTRHRRRSANVRALALALSSADAVDQLVMRVTNWASSIDVQPPASLHTHGGSACDAHLTPPKLASRVSPAPAPLHLER
ncbi:hypothetical protein C8R43DRAFT_1150901 [Mycena crocata]|nr:hypothetical protein C8R43DRAFT_1150901 [Mycena crocata]